MADNTSSLNENLIAAGLNTSNPNSTYVDFAEAVARNQQEQAAQEQALALAKERVSQAKHQTKEEGEAEAAGYNSILKDTMTPDEAVAYVKIALKAKGELDDATQTLIDEWSKTLPARVERQEVEAFLSRTSRETLKLGNAAKFETTDKLKIPAGSTAEDLGLVADKKDPTIGHVPEDGMYQVGVDNQGIVKRYVPGGKEPADPSVKLNAKMAESTEKQWQKLDKEINTAFKTRSGGLGSLSTAIFRAVRAINTITSTENITAQDLANISQDIAGIFQGGAPTVVTARDNDYSTIFTNFANEFRKYTGVLPKFSKMFGKDSGPLEDTKEKLLQVLVDLRDSSIANIKTYIESEEPAFKDIIEADPERWTQMQDKKLKFIESGLLVPAGANTKLNITGMDGATETKHPTEKKAKLPKGAVPSYTVEE